MGYSLPCLGIKETKKKPQNYANFYPISFFETLPLNLGSYMTTSLKEIPIGLRNSIYEDKKCKKLFVF
jgi:hypothetical protein